jgi:NadR type nicotinamide-nucleotide adenylyltransferase
LFKVGIIGPESSGKSTLARYLADRYGGLLVPEYARTFVEQKGTTEVTWDELCAIARHQVKELMDAQRDKAQCTKVVFFDTELIVTKVWFDYAFGRVPEWLERDIRRFPMDVYLLTSPDIPWVPDPARSNGSDEIRKELFGRYEAEIQALDVPYYIITHLVS